MVKLQCKKKPQNDIFSLNIRLKGKAHECFRRLLFRSKKRSDQTWANTITKCQTQNPAA